MKISMTITGLMVAVATTLSVLPVRAEEAKFGFVDMNKAVQGTESGKRARKDLEGDYAAKKKKLEQKEKDLNSMREDLEKKAMVLSEEVRDKKRREFQEEMMKYQKMLQESQSDIQKRQTELIQPIVDKIQKIVDDIATKEKYAMVFVKTDQTVLWAKKELDLTDRVVADFNKQDKK